VVFDQSLSPGEIAKDIAKHPWVLVGFTGFVLLIPLAVPSTNGWVRRLGGKRWQGLHRLIYAAAVCGALHYLWLVKKDVRASFYYGAVLLVIFLLRAWVAAERRRVLSPPPAARTALVPAATRNRAALRLSSSGGLTRPRHSSFDPPEDESAVLQRLPDHVTSIEVQVALPRSGQ
jgi:DMSO/TMAO reductase YedYZ heme-binding membrane subunit